MRGPDIREDDLGGSAIRHLLAEHLDNMHEITPPGSVHAMNVDRLRSTDITFWTAWQETELLGCAALRELDAHRGEIKSMRTAVEHRRQGVATLLLEHLIGVAGERGYTRLLLETGAFPAFEPARALYRRHGFTFCGPFAEYRDDPNSVFMCRELP